MSARFLLCILLGLGGTAASAAEKPSVVELSNPTLRLVVLIPGAGEAFQNEARFDHSGIVGFAEAEGHVFIGRKAASASMGETYSLGTSDEFLTPLPVSENGTVIKIGAGLARAKDGNLQNLELVEAFPWFISQDVRSIKFEQSVSNPSGWGYQYVKQVVISEDKPEFQITHIFKNTGQRAIRTETYCHNWLLLDGRGVGPSVRFEFPYEIDATEISPKQGGRLNPRDITFSPDSTSPPSHPFFAALRWQDNPSLNSVTLSNHELGVSIKISGDWAPFKHHIYATANELCPEPFYLLDVEPGGERRWTANYQFLSSQP